ncbi:ribosome small subunit-dependent GTPase A [Symbiobacterium thermophilum]|uniref:Small ribosomal subunit biogenesis GTPase RsgA n=1 Tax=Symbiobacterium thermophilum (strain DSM 24528 / JCM 14929 / IAM 14863 / T) TaxID=292459 RepID=Q67PQ4_SYMTH|nr:ribosome small subunit-dependent GTPase A [Symbiobacterium thermophilum]BAD40339.1 putative GTPase [Symbiobacterium thermophilum IAM 14863]
MPVGQVIRSHSNIYYVLVDGREVECRPRGKFRLDRLQVRAGDEVEVTLAPDGEGRIEKVLPRRNCLERPPVANVDQCLVVFTLVEPEADYLFLDRVLVHVEQAGVEPLILLNKIDLVEEADVAAFVRLYGDLVGYRVLPISAAEGRGLDELRRHLAGKTSVLAGHSGVGKSRLVRALEPQRADVRIGDLSAKSRKGRHTTRHVELIPLTGGGLLADAPGFTYLEFQDIDKWTLRDCFREFARYQAECRYADCLHRKEPDCAVRDAVEAGAIPESRHRNYLMFLDEVEAMKRW